MQEGAHVLQQGPVLCCHSGVSLTAMFVYLRLLLHTWTTHQPSLPGSQPLKCTLQGTRCLIGPASLTRVLTPQTLPSSRHGSRCELQMFSLAHHYTFSLPPWAGKANWVTPSSQTAPLPSRPRPPRRPLRM